MQDKIKVKRQVDRAKYDRETLDRILDEALVGHVAFQDSGHVFNIPMIFARNGDKILLHSSVKSRIYEVLASGTEVNITVTIVDGIVLAKSAYHSSMNYRSAMVFGETTAILDPDSKMAASKLITEKIAPGRWNDCRKPNVAELKATGFVEVQISEFSSKIRQGPPVDDPADLSLPNWYGVIPVSLSRGIPIGMPEDGKSIEIPEYLKSF